ncbi:AI-2E family transporter [Furfurilactobacillus siliginis]|nr:AI-2E family transporter [Furfurilactobacillus siliginis]GEK27972.1 AI-2E family transporter [Furfurilactobacillus siliginis]
MAAQQPKRPRFLSGSTARRIITYLVMILLAVAILWILSQIKWIFRPFQQFFAIVGAPIILAGVFYYLLNPIVDWLDRRFKIRRSWSIIGLFILVGGLLAWGLVALIPVLQEQISSLVKNWPHYWDSLLNSSQSFWQDANFKWGRDLLNQYDSQLEKSMSGLIKNTAFSTVGGISSVVGSITTALIALVTFPFLLWYMLRDGRQFPKAVARFLPDRLQPSFLKVLNEMNNQVANYIRGQLTVAFFVALMFYVGYLIIGLKFALVLGIVAGLLNLIPYLGSFLAMVPAVVIGIFISPWMLVKVLIVFIIEQTIEGRLISPLVLGQSLKIHPVTIIIVLLASGKIFGVLGVIFGVPGYAILKVIGSHLYQYWRAQSRWYQSSTNGDDV